jgi:hypothetical protein
MGAAEHGGRLSQPPGSDAQLKRLHVVGCQRSGTTLVAELLATCFENNGHADHELSIFRAPPVKLGLYVSKKPADVKRIEPVLRADPNLFVVNVERDPRAVITSIHRHRPEVYLSDYGDWAKCIEAARRLAHHPNFLTIRYERLVSAPDATQMEIEGRFPFLVRKHKFSEFDRFARPSNAAREALGSVRPVAADRVEAWRQQLPRLKGELLRHPEMVEALIEMGYERDDSWTSVLDGVAPQEQPRRSRFRRFFQQMDQELRYRLKQWRYIARLAGRESRLQ